MSGPEKSIGQHEVAGDTFMDAFLRVYRALERLPHDQRRRLITAVQALLPPDPNAIGVGILTQRDYLRAGGILSPDQELKQRQEQAQRDMLNIQSGALSRPRLDCGELGCSTCDPFTTSQQQGRPLPR